MNEFLEQFLLESRELVEQATGDLLGLEENPQDNDRLDSAFRAFHTLKGAAGIVDFAAMGRALHAAEDVLSRLRNGQAPVSAKLVSDSLTCLDQVVQWLDAMQETGEVPTDAEAAADAIVARFADLGKAPATPSPPAASTIWADALIEKYPEPAAAARVAIRYRPDAECFFRGDDPLALMAALPGLLVLDLASGEVWPTLDALDPFACQLVLAALSTASMEAVAAHFGGRGDEIEIKPLAGVPAELTGALSVEARRLLEAQLLLLKEPTVEGAAGRMAAAGRVAANVLRHAGRPADALRIEQVAASLDALSKAIAAVLGGAAIAEAAVSEAGAAVSTQQDATARILRVDVARIDTLVKLTGELTVAKNALGYAAALAQDGADPKALASTLKDQQALFERLINELQQSVLGIRVLPLRHVFQRFPRLVRDMAAALGKSVRLVTEGDATEADKAVVESLFEPLLHLVRNALDHGVETEQDRVKAGKPPIATIHLRGARSGEHVLIEVEDDGRGVDLARVRRVAAERGVVSAEALAAMGDAEVAELIFAPGFSTASEVTNLSGRGVGMDAVRTAVGRLGGRVTLENRPALGARMRLTLPFTLMMTRLMTVEAGGQMFGIPMEAVMETVKVAHDRIVPVGAARAFVLRNRTIPLIDLAEALGEPRPVPPKVEAKVVVVSIGAELGGLEVDRLGERIDVMLKPMDGLLSGMPGIAGTTLLGDGRVLIVLDLRELLQ